MYRQLANYLGTIALDTINDKNVRAFPTGLKKYETANPVHAAQLREATDKLKKHFSNPKPLRPLNNLILGPAGSGKTYLAEQFEAVTDAKLLQFNVSQCEQAEEIKTYFRHIADILEEQRVIAFFDEFDVRVGASSAIRFLIQPMYDGKFGDANLSRAAFIFSGSYLKDRYIFDNIGHGTEGVDFIGFLYDAYVHGKATHCGREVLSELLDLTIKYYPIRQLNLPTTNVLEYVRSLDKIDDFLSRLNGFVVELPDLSSPLDVTREQFNIEMDSLEATPVGSTAAQLIELVDGLRRTNDADRFLDYRDRVTPILEYKNLILLDRLGRVMSMLTKFFGRPVKIMRSLLNYLTTAPLVHGMRSLNSIIEILDKDSSGVLRSSGNTDLMRRHIANYRDFPTPERMWALVQECNATWAKDVRDATISIG